MIRSILLCGILLTCAHTLLAQRNAVQFARFTTPYSEKSYYRLGDQVLTIRRQGDPSGQPFIFLNLHHNETTASEAALDFVEKNGGALISLENNYQRNVDFEFIDRKYSLDPNNIFTKKGRALQSGTYKPFVLVSVQRFAIFFLNELPENKAIVAMHNHDNGEWGIGKFEKGKLRNSVRDLYINPEMDEDDYYVTADETVFQQLKERKMNVMLRNINRNQDDGSLLYYFGHQNRVYVDLVTEFGHYREQQEMVSTLAGLLKGF